MSIQRMHRRLHVLVASQASGNPPAAAAPGAAGVSPAGFRCLSAAEKVRRPPAPWTSPAPPTIGRKRLWHHSVSPCPSHADRVTLARASDPVASSVILEQPPNQAVSTHVFIFKHTAFITFQNGQKWK